MQRDVPNISVTGGHGSLQLHVPNVSAWGGSLQRDVPNIRATAMARSTALEVELKHVIKLLRIAHELFTIALDNVLDKL